MRHSLSVLLFVLSLNLFAQENTFSLDQAIDYAIENSYASKNATLNIDKAKKKKWETTTIGLPQINAKVDYQNFIKQPVSLIPAQFFDSTAPDDQFAEFSFGTKQNVNATATLTQLLFDGSYLVGLQSAKVFLKISELAKIKTEQAIREAVINAYGNVLLTKESISILESNIKILDKNINDTQQIFENGFIEEQNVQQLKITHATLKNQLNKVNRLLIIAKNMLKITLGIDIEQQINLSETLESLVLKNTDLDLYGLNFNLDNHIDYKIAENSVTANKLLMKFEKSKNLPSLAAFANYGVTANNNDFKFTSSNQKWFGSSLFGVSLNVPIFSSFKRSAKTQQAKISLNQSQIKLDETAQKLKLQVESAKANYQFSIDNYITNKENLALAEQIEKKEQIKFFEGVGSSFELSQAQNQLYSIQQQYLEAILAIINSKASLENALNNQNTK